VSVGIESPDLDAWLVALQHRHRSAFTSAEFLKALRALSVRYVERRSEIGDRSPLDSAGKRAAFAAFYAPLHFVTTLEVLRALSRGPREEPGPPTPHSRWSGHREFSGAGGRARGSGTPRAQIIDLGCGTGVASAAWALAHASAQTTSLSAGRRTPASDAERQHLDEERLAHRDSPALVGVDSHPWALAETRWNWRQLRLTGEVRRLDLVTLAEALLSRRPSSLAHTGFIVGWSVNELDNAKRHRLLAALIAAAAAGAAVLVIEPIARSAVPWWDEWAAAFVGSGGRADEWKFDVALPSVLAALDDAAGFRRLALAARSLSAGL
jgi:hypothetical protein